MPVLYFAYGSNMCSAQMQERCPGAKALGYARLVDYRLAFDKWSERRGGYVADVLPQPGEAVWGVLWQVTQAHTDTLDNHEGVARGQYRRQQVILENKVGGRLSKAYAYVICEPSEEGPTTHAYRKLLLAGAQEHGVPQRYLDALEALTVA